MLIRSQNKRRLVPVDHELFVFTSYQDVDKSIAEYQIRLDVGDPDGNGDIILGTYRSEQRCIEILDAIQIEIQYENHFSHSGVNSIDCQDWNYGVYQMPEQEEARSE